MLFNASLVSFFLIEKMAKKFLPLHSTQKKEEYVCLPQGPIIIIPYPFY